MAKKVLPKLKLHKAIVGRRGTQLSQDRVCGDPTCNTICDIVPVIGSKHEFNVHCPEHGYTATISWHHHLSPPHFLKIQTR